MYLSVCLSVCLFVMCVSVVLYGRALIDGKAIVGKCRSWLTGTSDEETAALVALLQSDPQKNVPHTNANNFYTVPENYFIFGAH